MDEYDNFPPVDQPRAPKNEMTPQKIEVQVIEKEDEVLQFTQGARQKIVKALMGKSIDDLNASQISLLTASLDGMDRSALGRKRLQTDEKVGANNAMVAAVIAQVLAAPGSQRVGMVQEGQVPRREIPRLPAEVPDPITVPGEMESDAPQMNFDTFMAQTSTDGA
jgi:hypothetical protein